MNVPTPGYSSLAMEVHDSLVPGSLCSIRSLRGRGDQGVQGILSARSHPDTLPQAGVKAPG